MVRPLGNSKKRAGRPKKPGCSTCKQRGLQCDETLPICQRCKSSGRVCKGLWNTTTANTRVITAEPGASPAIDAPGLGEVHTENYMWIDGCKGQKDFENTLTRKRAADTASILETKRARQNEQEGADSTVVCGTIREQATKEDNLKSASAFNASEGPLRTSHQMSSGAQDTIQTAQMALWVVDAKPAALTKHRRSEPSQEKIPSDSRVELNYASPYSHSTDGGSQQTRTEDSTHMEQQPSATECSRDRADESQSKNHRNDLQPPLSTILSQEPSNSNGSASVEDNQLSSVSSPEPGQLEQDLRRVRNSQADRSPSQNTSIAERVSLSSELQNFGISSTTRNGKLPMTRNCPDLPRASAHTPNQTSVQDTHAGSQSFKRQRVSSADITGGPQGDSSLNHDQRQSSANSPQRERHDHRLGLIKQNSNASSCGQLLPPQRICQPPAVTFTADNRIQTPLPIATVESLVEIFSRNCKVLLPTKDTLYPVDVIMWQHLPDFYRWYMAETGADKVSTLRFELFDAERKLEWAFPIPVGNQYYFQMLKQYIWDSFWVPSELNHTPADFKILVKPAPDLDNRALPRSPVSAKQINATASGLPAAYDGCPHNTKATARQTPFTTPAQRPKNNGTAPQIQTTRLPEHSELSMVPLSQIHDSGIPVDVVTQVLSHQPQNAQLRNPVLRIPPLTPEISVRLQTDGAGRVSDSYSKWVLRPGITSSDFFAWFASQTGRGGDGGPPSLRFTFKDAMPCPMSSMITQVNEDHFNLMKRELRTQFERARKYVPNLKEFVVFVTDPGWVLEEDDW